MNSLRHHMALHPLFFVMAVGVVFVGAYTIRLATKTTDIGWVRHDDCVNEVLADKQFQMLNPAGYDLAGSGKDRPKYRDM